MQSFVAVVGLNTLLPNGAITINV